MIRQLFPSDKNYLLADVQHEEKHNLLKFLVDFVKDYYLQHSNPLGLIDDTILQIQKSNSYPVEPFEEFYHDLAALYRFKHGEVQLEFLFDGSSHSSKYVVEWNSYFKKSIREFCANRYFVRAILDISVFHNTDRVAFLASDRLKYFLNQYFGLKVYKYRGIMEVAS